MRRRRASTKITRAAKGEEPFDRGALRIAETRRLLADRYGGQPTNDDVYREFERHGLNPLHCSDDEAGEAVALELEERKRLGIRTMHAANVSRSQQRAYYRDQRRETDRIRKQRKRLDHVARIFSAASLDVRAEALLEIVPVDGWDPVSAFTTDLYGHKAFAVGRRGKAMSLQSLRVEVHRLLKGLAGAGMVQIEHRRNGRNRPVAYASRLRLRPSADYNKIHCSIVADSENGSDLAKSGQSDCNPQTEQTASADPFYNMSDETLNRSSRQVPEEPPANVVIPFPTAATSRPPESRNSGRAVFRETAPSPSVDRPPETLAETIKNIRAVRRDSKKI